MQLGQWCDGHRNVVISLVLFSCTNSLAKKITYVNGLEGETPFQRAAILCRQIGNHFVQILLTKLRSQTILYYTKLQQEDDQ